MTSATLEIRCEREGLILKLYTVYGLLTTVDLKEKLHLSEEGAALLLKELEESKKEKAD